VGWHHWGALMSGAFSVPFTAVGTLFESVPAKPLWLLLAFASLVMAAYLIWAGEREKTIRLQARLEPKLRGSFNMYDPDCVRRNTNLQGGKGDWYRVKLESINDATVRDCSARLLHYA
jgi:hypothetical protein